MTEPQIPLFRVSMPPRGELMPRLEQVLYSGMVGEGEEVRKFEQRFGDWLGGRPVLSFSSGTAALHTALMMTGVGPGDQVISTAMTAEPSNMAIRHCGAEIVWADVDPMTGNLDPTSVAAAISARTKAILVVHYGGHPADLDGLRRVAADAGVMLIEDAAHALGARWRGLPIGGSGAITMFSFQAIKHMTTIDGGMLAIDDPERLPEGRRLRWFGIDRQQDRLSVEVSEVGYKYHMNNVTAAIGLAQMDHIDGVIARHTDNGRWFDRALAQIPGLVPSPHPPHAEPSYWFYTVLAERSADLQRALAEAGIASSKIHRRNDLHPVFASSKRPLPGLDRFWERALHIPCGWWVDDAARERIVAAIRRGW
ncbi:MAG: DegT/DnrJ/EryC1/StrS family aminotransferase [Alphaproteobacteria bacterium]|nr:DegT/DnrJ/EryC1/StrS family aminotransferase [Alphaproteobacteria bacterium]